jgi:hypothetical protein
MYHENPVNPLCGKIIPVFYLTHTLNKDTALINYPHPPAKHRDHKIHTERTLLR